MKKLTHEEIVSSQSNNKNHPRLPVAIILDNIRSVHNIGAAFRIADGAGVEKVWLCGISAYPPHPQLTKTAIGAEDTVPWEYEKNVETAVRTLKTQGYQIVIVEQTNQSISYHDFVPQYPVCLIFGNEVEGVSKEVIPLADAAVDIPMRGIKNSINVSVACGIVVYHYCNNYKPN